MSFLRSLLLFFVSAFLCIPSGNAKDLYKEHRVLILLDASSSMVESWGGTVSRFEAAAGLVSRLMDSVYYMNKDVQFGLRVYGHQYGVPENNCYDTRSEVMFSKDNRIQMALRMASLRPFGVSPIAYSLQTAAEKDFVLEKDYTYSLLLITDGGESCGGDICAVVNSLLNKKINFRPYIVSLVDYAPLKEQYDCLGTYFTAADTAGIALAVDSISSYYRKTLQSRIARDIPSVAPAVAAVPARNRIAAPPPREPEEVTVPAPSPVAENNVTEPSPAVTEPEKRPSKIQVADPRLTKDSLRPIHMKREVKRFPLYWSTYIPGQLPVPVQALPVPDKTAAPAAQPPLRQQTRTPQETSPEKQQETSFTAATEPAPETLLSIYFTDGKGKFYQSTPPVKVIDQQTRQQVKRFFRTTDPSGQPDPQELPPGLYTILVGKKENLIVKDVRVLPGQKNKITVLSLKGTLAFGYEGTSGRKVSEFVAVVKKNFEPGPLTQQRCDTELEYESGNYHVEINTLPVSRRNIDLEFGSSYRIDIPEPGFIQFTNTAPVGKVSLYFQLGDQFVRFYAIDLNGNRTQQKLRLQPGKYEVRYSKRPDIPVHREEVFTFNVRSNETTEMELP